MTSGRSERADLPLPEPLDLGLVLGGLDMVVLKPERDDTFLLMTDRNDLDGQIYKTFVGCGVANPKTPRAASGDDLQKLLKENHAYIFSLIHKFNQDVKPDQPYSERGDIIVISDEAHRTQSGRLARNMRVALPNAAFIGFTGTPLFRHDELTRRIFGDYVSRTPG